MNSPKVIYIEILFFFAVLTAYMYSVSLDVNTLRQFLALLTFLFFPGCFILRICGLNRMNFLEKVVLSFGLSIACIMLLGALINWVLYTLGNVQPLSFNSIWPLFIATTILLGIVSWLVNPDSPDLNDFVSKVRAIFGEPIILLSFLFPTFALLGVEQMNLNNNNLILLSIYIAIPIFIILLFFTRPKMDFIYAGSIWAISLALVWMYSMRSDYILGYDAHFEYYLSQIVFQNSYWNATISLKPANACLSVVILPPIIESLSNINGVYIYKIVYSFVFSMITISIFYSIKKYANDELAFLGSFFFVSQIPIILASQSNPRTSVALLFFSLFILVLVEDAIQNYIKKILMIIFIISLIVSHYATGIFFIIIISFGYLGGLFENFFTKASYLIIQKNLIFLASIFIFLWYAQICETNFDQGIIYATKEIFNSFGNFFVAETRQEGTLQVMGIGASGLGDYLYSASHYMVSLVIAFGTLDIIYMKLNKSKFWIVEELPYYHLGMIFGAGVILGSIILIPRLSVEYSVDRLWSQSMILLSFSYVVGGYLLFERRSKNIALALLLIMTFIFYANSTYLVYQFLGEPRSLVLNSDGPDFSHLYIHDTETTAALWLSGAIQNESWIYSDIDTSARFRFTKGIKSNWDTITLFQRNLEIGNGNYLYMGYMNVIFQKFYWGVQSYSLKRYADLYERGKKIYNSGSVNIFYF